MYRFLRTLHRWIGLTGSLFLVLTAGTGFLLATKGSLAWVRPPNQEGASIAGLSEVVSVHDAAEAAFAKGLAKLQSMKDIDRIDYRPGDNIFKVVSKEGYHEVQVDGKTGEVLSVAFRTDQLTEDIHDLSYFSDAMHTWWLPVVSVLLFCLGVTGIVIFFVPIFRRMKFRRSGRGQRKP